MNTIINHIKTHTNEAHQWANKLIAGLDDEKWFHTPDVIETNIAWQIGHLTLNQYFYTVVLIHGPDIAFAEEMDMKKYSALFANGDGKRELVNKITVHELEDKWNMMQDHTNEALGDLLDEDLSHEIYKIATPHPFVKTKENSISWNIKHTMWHCGQIGMIKRVVDKRYDFGF